MLARIAHRRRVLVLACAIAAVAAAAASAGTRVTTPSCRTDEVTVHDEAVFGHFASKTTASALAHRATGLGFKGIKIENDGCRDYEVEIDGADTASSRNSFAAEADKAGFTITFEQTAPPLAYHRGQQFGNLGRFTSLVRANSLAYRLAHAGFVYIDIARYGSEWIVVMPQVPSHAVPSVTAELQHAGFNALFQPGF